MRAAIADQTNYRTTKSPGAGSEGPAPGSTESRQRHCQTVKQHCLNFGA
jgi:hypothetical protein